MTSTDADEILAEHNRAFLADKIAALRGANSRAEHRKLLTGMTLGTLTDLAVQLGADLDAVKAARTWREMDRLVLATLDAVPVAEAGR